MKQKIYIETSVISYNTSKPSRDLIVAAQQQITLAWWEYNLPNYEPFISTIIIEEISKGDREASLRRLNAVSGISILEVNSDVISLSEEYFNLLKLPEKAKADSYHLAISVIHKIDFLVSWNCSHIVGANIRRLIENFNLANNLFLPILCTPYELFEEKP